MEYMVLVIYPDLDFSLNHSGNLDTVKRVSNVVSLSLHRISHRWHHMKVPKVPKPSGRCGTGPRKIIHPCTVDSIYVQFLEQKTLQILLSPTPLPEGSKPCWRIATGLRKLSTWVPPNSLFWSSHSPMFNHRRSFPVSQLNIRNILPWTRRIGVQMYDHCIRFWSRVQTNPTDIETRLGAWNCRVSWCGARLCEKCLISYQGRDEDSELLLPILTIGPNPFNKLVTSFIIYSYKLFIRISKLLHLCRWFSALRGNQ